MQLCSNTFRQFKLKKKKKKEKRNVYPAREQPPGQPKSRELVLSGDQKQNQGKRPPSSICRVIIIKRTTTDAHSKITIKRQRLPEKLPPIALGFARRFDFKT